MSNFIFKSINAKTAPQPVGAYSSAVQYGNTLYLSGMIGIDKNTGKLVPGGIVPETEQIFKNIEALLSEIGSSFSQVVTAKIYLDDITNGPKVNEIYQKYLKPPYPARCMMEVSKLPLGAKIEVETMATMSNQCRL